MHAQLMNIEMDVSFPVTIRWPEDADPGCFLDRGEARTLLLKRSLGHRTTRPTLVCLLFVRFIHAGSSLPSGFLATAAVTRGPGSTAGGARWTTLADAVPARSPLNRRRRRQVCLAIARERARSSVPAVDHAPLRSLLRFFGDSTGPGVRQRLTTGGLRGWNVHSSALHLCVSCTPASSQPDSRSSKSISASRRTLRQAARILLLSTDCYSCCRC